MKEKLLKLHIFIGILICFLLPLYQKIIPILIVLWALSFLIFGISKDFFKNILKNRNAFAGILFFVIHFIALLYTENIKSGWFDIESKLSFLIFPIIMSQSSSYYSKKTINRFLEGFIVGCIVASIYCLCLAFYKWLFLDVPFQYFTYVDLSAILHPTYFSMYLSFALIASIYLFVNHYKKSRIQKMFLVFVLSLFAIMIYLLSSKAGLLTCFILVLFLVFYFVKRKKLLVLVFLSTVVVFAVLLTTHSRFSSFRVSLIENVFNSDDNTEVTNNSTDKRFKVWKTALSLVKENWLIGVSAGDLKYKLTDKYHPNKSDSEEANYLNAHNQYLETLLSVGIFGFLILFFWLFEPLSKITIKKSLLILGLFIILIINFTFESVLNRQEGIVFVVFFWTLLISKLNSGLLKTQ
ncbi:MAG: O-antigen ligase family protein [Brumimicrobium sp.]